MSFAQTLLLNENFDYGMYDNSDIINVTSNWTRHNGSQGPAYKAQGLVYLDYPSSDIGGACEFTQSSSGVNDGDVNRTFTAFDTLSNKNVYVSFLLRIDTARSSADYFFHLGPSPIGTTFRARIFIRSNGAGWSLGLSKSTESSINDNTVLTLGQTYLMVLKYSIVTGGNDTVKLYVYNSGLPLSEPGSPIVTIGPVGSVTGADPVNIGSVAIRQGTNTPRGRIDGIRVANSWSDAPLPVQLSSFVGYFINNNSVKLEWETISEVNNFGFYVEKLNPITNLFTTIEESFQPGAGTTYEPKRYFWIDENVIEENLQYRLRQVDNDGLESYFGPIMLNPNSADNPTIILAEFKLNQNYPNPFNPKTNISFTVANNGYTTLKVYNLLGNEIATLYAGTAEVGKRYEVTFDRYKALQRYLLLQIEQFRSNSNSKNVACKINLQQF